MAAAAARLSQGLRPRLRPAMRRFAAAAALAAAARGPSCVASAPMAAFPAAFVARRAFGGAAAKSPGDSADALIAENGCVVFAKSTCPYCDRAKAVLLSDLKAKCKWVDIDKTLSYDDMNAIQTHFLSKTGSRSVPRVFIGGTCVGGGDDVVALHAKGQLKGLLQKAGAL
mmetsp:Transcript_64349/g.168433  ORF Transcript_64349/g.168433 Transcript_64349/m.168433 type:complete len:170 (+) Transcript_64349:56-565(+)